MFIDLGPFEHQQPRKERHIASCEAKLFLRSCDYRHCVPSGTKSTSARLLALSS